MVKYYSNVADYLGVDAVFGIFALATTMCAVYIFVSLNETFGTNFVIRDSPI